MREPDYHDYVIKDGKLIGKFEEMYQDCSDPWHQGAKQDRKEITIMFKMLKGRKFSKILELGCGHGHIANKLLVFGHVLGLDISPTSIKKARNMYPNVEFDVCDMIIGIDDRNNRKQITTDIKEKFDLIVLSGTLWYVVEHIDKVFLDIKEHLNFNGEFFITLSYPSLNENFYSKNILYNGERLIEYVTKYFDIIFSRIIEGEQENSPVVIIHAKKRD